MQALRLRYNAAVAAHADCSRALADVSVRGEQPSPAMVKAEAMAKTCLIEARKRLHEAMALAMAQGGADTELSV